MLKDDRMMSMLTFVVIMVAIGTMIQRVDVIDEFFGGGGKVALELRRDEAIVRANTLSAIDVLANDVGLGTRDADNLVIVEQPECGRVFARGGEAQYLPAERCAGAQMFRYAISGRGEQTGEVTVIVRLGDVTQNEVAADAQRDVPTPTPIAPRASEQQTGQSPSLGPEPTQLANSGGETVQAPEVPRPQAPVIGSLTDASSASQVDTASAGVLAHDRPELAPRVAAPGGGLTHGLASTSTPTIPGRLAATQASPEQDGPERAGPQQPGSDQTGPVQAAPSQPEPGQSSSAAPVTEIPLPGTASAATMALARIDPTQPAADAGGGSGATVLNEQEATARSQHAPDFGEDLQRVRHAAQCPAA